MALTIACCLWGEFPLRGWSQIYVERLRNGVARHLAKEHRFICFTNEPILLAGVEVRPLNPPSWMGNLPKTYVYSPEARLEGRVILFDLDNVIVGSLADMAAYDGPLCVRGRLHNVKPRQPDGDMISFHAGTVMTAHLWNYAQDPKAVTATQGRERDFILQVAPDCDQWQDECPGQVVSYRHQCKGRLPRNARVVSCHGKPRPHEITDAFITENWR